ncbi:hypothetical protein EJD97_025253, partial [Solanum chilense]
MYDPSSASKKMLTSLSEIEPIAFYSPSFIGSRSNLPPSSSPYIPENPVHSIDLNSSSVPTGPGNKSSESNILSASEELVIESLAMMREEVTVEESEPYFGRYPSSDSFDSVSDEQSIQWRVQRREMMADALKASAKSTSKNMSARTFKVSNFKMPESRVIDVSTKETEKGYRKKRCRKTKPRDAKKAEQTKSTKETSKGKRKWSQGPCTQRKIEEQVSKQETADNLRKQSVLAGRIFDMGIINLPGTDSLHDMVEIQSWMHLFNKKSPILHEKEVREFYYNIQFQEYGSVNTRGNDIAFHLDETLLGKFLGYLKMRTSATSADLYVMELLCKFEPLNLPRIMLEHMYKTIIERKGIHGMVNGYFFTKLFKYFNIPLSVGKVGTVKQAFSGTTLVECECIEGKGNPKIKIAQLIEDQDQVKHEVEELTMRLSSKDA